jgi:hypothetical protein
MANVIRNAAGYLKGLYNASMERFMEPAGFVRVEKAVSTFGGEPRLAHAGLVNMHRGNYTYLGDFKIPYDMIHRAVREGQTSLAFTNQDLGETCLFVFGQITELRKRAIEEGTNSLTTRLTLDFDYSLDLPGTDYSQHA